VSRLLRTELLQRSLLRGQAGQPGQPRLQERLGDKLCGKRPSEASPGEDSLTRKRELITPSCSHPGQCLDLPCQLPMIPGTWPRGSQTFRLFQNPGKPSISLQQLSECWSGLIEPRFISIISRLIRWGCSCHESWVRFGDSWMSDIIPAYPLSDLSSQAFTMLCFTFSNLS
jgi:hypothetical protein